MGYHRFYQILQRSQKKKLKPVVSSHLNNLHVNTPAVSSTTANSVIHLCIHMCMTPNLRAYDPPSLLRGKPSGLMISALVTESSAPGSSPGRGNCVVFLGKTLYSHGVSNPPRYVNGYRQT